MQVFYVFCNNIQVNMTLERVFTTEQKANEWDAAYSQAWSSPPCTNIVPMEALYDDITSQWILQITEDTVPVSMSSFTDAQIALWEDEILQLSGFYKVTETDTITQV